VTDLGGGMSASCKPWVICKQSCTSCQPTVCSGQLSLLLSARWKMVNCSLQAVTITVLVIE